MLLVREARAYDCQIQGNNLLWISAGYYEKSGGFCPTHHMCTGSLYPESEYETERGLYRVRVQMYRTLTGQLLLDGYTTDWGMLYGHEVYVGPTSDNQSNTYPWCFWDEDVTIKVSLREVNGKFKIVTNGSGTTYSQSFIVPAFHITPYYFVDLGSSASPSPHANVYMAAARAWDRLEESSVLMSLMDPWLFLATSGGTSANTDLELITVGPDGYYNLAAAHEMGHIAENELSQEDVCARPGEYCYLDSACTHNYLSEEYHSAAYAEGLAGFVLATALWAQSAGMPQLCSASAGGCRIGYSVEAGVGSGFCRESERRKEINTTRYLWDLWDTIDDEDYDDTVSRNFETVFADAIGAFPAGYGDHQVNEPFGASSCGGSVSFDTRDATDHRHHFEANTGISVRTQAQNNCVD